MSDPAYAQVATADMARKSAALCEDWRIVKNEKLIKKNHVVALCEDG